MSLAEAAADVRKRDVEVMAGFRAFPRILWSEATNRHVAFAQREICAAYRDISTAVQEEEGKVPKDSDLRPLGDAIRDYCDGAAEAADCYVRLASFMDEHAVRRPVYALINGWKKTREISRIERILDEAQSRIKQHWPSQGVSR